MNAFGKLAEATVRIDAIVWIPAAITAVESFGETFGSLVEDFPTKRNHQVFKRLPQLLAIAGADTPMDELAEHLAGVEGYFFKVATPLFYALDSDKPSSWSYNWGAHYEDWLYAATTEEMIDLAVAWAEERHESDLKKEAA